MQCSACGNIIPPSVWFCAYCGARTALVTGFGSPRTRPTLPVGSARKVGAAVVRAGSVRARRNPRWLLFGGGATLIAVIAVVIAMATGGFGEDTMQGLTRDSTVSSPDVSQGVDETSSPGPMPAELPIAVSNLEILGANPFQVGQTTSARFSIKNEGSVPITFEELSLRVRLNGVSDCSNPGGVCLEFTKAYDITLEPGYAYLYRGTFVADQPGNYGVLGVFISGGQWYCIGQTQPNRLGCDPVASYAAAAIGTGDPETLAERRECAQESSLRSKDGRTPTAINFVNLASQPIRIYWLDYDGRRKLYHTLEPTQGYTQNTYLTHPWVTTTTSGECLGIYLPADSLKKVVVTGTEPAISGLSEATSAPTPVPTATPAPVPTPIPTATATPTPMPTDTPRPAPTATPRLVPQGTIGTLDDTKIAFVSNRDGNSEIYVMNPDGSDQTRLTHNDNHDWWPSWSPDGQRIAFACQPGGGSFHICVINADGSSLRVFVGGRSNAQHPSWSPDGRRVAFSAFCCSGNIYWGPFDIYVKNVDGPGQTQLTSSPDDDSASTWSPDGRRIAFVSDRVGNDELYVMNADGSGQTRLTSSPWSDSSPAWSKDGLRIAFASVRDGREDIWLMNTDGSGQTNLTNSHRRDNRDPSWSPDGARIAFTSDPDSSDGRLNDEIYVMNADGSNQTRLTHNPADDWGHPHGRLF